MTRFITKDGKQVLVNDGVLFDNEWFVANQQEGLNFLVGARRLGKSETMFDNYTHDDAEFTSRTFENLHRHREPRSIRTGQSVQVTVVYHSGGLYTKTCKNMYHANNFCKKVLREYGDKIEKCIIDNVYSYEWSLK